MCLALNRYGYQKYSPHNVLLMLCYRRKFRAENLFVISLMYGNLSDVDSSTMILDVDRQ